MRRLTVLSLCFCLLVVSVLVGCGSRELNRDPLYQYSFPNLDEAVQSESAVRPREISRVGNFGFGTLPDASGLLVLDGSDAFKINSGGTVSASSYHTTVSYSLLTNFDTDGAVETINTRSQLDFEEFLNDKIKSTNLFYAIKAQAEFDTIAVTSNPHRVKTDRSYNNVSGLLIGFRLPPHTGRKIKPGYHFVFLSRSKAQGGYVRDFTLSEASIGLDHIHDYTLSLPRTRMFHSQEFP